MVFKKLFIKNIKSYRNQKLKSYLFAPKLRLNFTPKIYNFYIPHTWDLVLLILNPQTRLNLLFLYSTIYFYKILIPQTFGLLRFCAYSRVLSLQVLNSQSDFWSLYVRLVARTLFCFTKPVFLRIKFKGKGYYIFKNKRNTIAPQFGYAHRIYIYTLFLSVKFLRKTSVLIFGLRSVDLSFVGTELYAKRPVNIFTNRGVRFSRQVIYKKKGKVSTYR